MANATQSKWQAERLQPAISQRLKKTMVQGELAHAYLLSLIHISEPTRH